MYDGLHPFVHFFNRGDASNEFEKPLLVSFTPYYRICSAENERWLRTQLWNQPWSGWYGVRGPAANPTATEMPVVWATALIKIAATIYVSQESQKGIVIGKKGAALKKTGTKARQRMQDFFQKKVFLKTHVKVSANWRQNEKSLEAFGYM